MSETVAILGGRGMLGTDLEVALRAAGYGTRVYDLPDFDLTDAEQVRRVLDETEAVINCAAYTQVDRAESEEALAFRVNGEAVGQLGRLAAAAGRWVLHVSTDFVFDGTLDRPYRETDAPNPLSVYGRSKLAGEQALVAAGAPHATVRVQWTYGRHGTHFVAKLLERARTQGSLTVVDDQVGSPTATVDVAVVLVDILRRRTTGLFHCASAGYVSRFDMARHVVAARGLTVPVTRCRTADFVTPAARPLNSRFNCDKLAALRGRVLPAWDASLTRYLEQA